MTALGLAAYCRLKHTPRHLRMIFYFDENEQSYKDIKYGAVLT